MNSYYILKPKKLDLEYLVNKYQPDLETLLEISKILEVDLKDLITDENERV